MEYSKQIKALVNYIRQAETKAADFKLGLEFENLVLNQDLTAVSYRGEHGISSILEKLSVNNWQKIYEAKNLIALQKDNCTITLEPGGQLELSISPYQSLKKIEKIYLAFWQEIKPILQENKQILMAVGYQPITKISEIPLLPKKRYHYMYKYFNNKGEFAHHMMKGTASLQLSIDYEDEADYQKKMRAAYFLTPMIYYLFDNTAFFSSKITSGPSVRANIWSHCDSNRSGIINGVFSENFSYKSYAEYILNTPAIIDKDNNKLVYSKETLIKDLMKNNNSQQIEHYLSMVFPDIRTKKYIEIRTADAVPYPYNFAFAALLKGLFYQKENLNYLYQESLKYNQAEFLDFKNKMLSNNSYQTRKALISLLIEKAASGLPAVESAYLDPLKDIQQQYGNFKNKTLALFKEKINKKSALQWCILDNKTCS